MSGDQKILFKNMVVYRLNMPELTEDALLAALDKSRAWPCRPTDREQTGFVSPVDGRSDGLLVNTIQGRMLVCLRTESKILPASVLKDAVKKRVDEIQKRDARKVYKKEREQITDEVMIDLLPRAFTRNAFLNALICPRDGYLIVNAGTHGKAEMMPAMLRDALGSLPLLPYAQPVEGMRPADVMAPWLVPMDDQFSAPEIFSIGRTCELYDPLHKNSVARFKDMDLDGEEVTSHIQAGMVVSRLSLTWDNQIQFTLVNDLTFRQIQFTEVFEENLGAVNEDDAAAVRDATLALMGGTLVKCLDDVALAFGQPSKPITSGVTG